MSYLVGDLETTNSGALVPALGQVTLTLPGREAFKALFPQVVLGPTPTPEQTQKAVEDAKKSSNLTEEQIKAILAGQQPKTGLLDNLPPWAPAAGLAAVVVAYLALRK